MKSEVITFGCRLNACESEVIASIAEELGLQNCVIINTCAVTSEAERQLQQTIRRIYKNNPKRNIILTGCASQLHAEKYLSMPGVIGIVSNKQKLIKEAYLDFVNDALGREAAVDTSDEQVYAVSPTISPKKIRSFIQIQNGCNHCCSYCIITKARGRNVSLQKDQILSACAQALANGAKEICLTGVNITSYTDPTNSEITLPQLCEYILDNLADLHRLRISSLDPADIDEHYIKLFENNDRMMPYIHLSIQSGDNTILKRMRRRHTYEDVLRICEKFRSVRQDIIFGADFITGFPSENDTMFANTIKLVQKAEISLLHVFPYSVRHGTTAASMPNQVPTHIRRQRARYLRQEGEQILRVIFKQIIDTKKVIRCIAESDNHAKSDGFLSIISTQEIKPGEVYDFLCSSYQDNQLIGKPV